MSRRGLITPPGQAARGRPSPGPSRPAPHRRTGHRPDRDGRNPWLTRPRHHCRVEPRREPTAHPRRGCTPWPWPRSSQALGCPPRWRPSRTRSPALGPPHRRRGPMYAAPSGPDKFGSPRLRIVFTSILWWLRWDGVVPNPSLTETHPGCSSLPSTRGAKPSWPFSVCGQKFTQIDPRILLRGLFPSRSDL